MSAALGFGMSKSNSSQATQGESGVSGPDRALATGKAFDTLGGISPLIQQFLQDVPQLSLTPQGLTQGQGSLANSLVSNAATGLFNKFSASGAGRGQLNPLNLSNVIGSASERAAASVLPQLITTSGQNTLFNTTAGQNTRGQGIGFLQNLSSLFTNLTQGSSQSSEGRSAAKSFNVSTAGGL